MNKEYYISRGTKIVVNDENGITHIRENCNNIDEGRINILEGALNIKYAVNGTGKSTISKALQAFIEDDDEQKKNLIQKIIG